MEFTYDIEGRIYVQRPLVLGQIKQLFEILQDVRIPADAGTFGLIQALGDRLFAALAVVLTEKGESPRDKDLVSLADTLSFSVTAEIVLKVIEDFFACNPVFSLLERLTGAMEQISANLGPIGSMSLSSSWPPGTSRGETVSSGDADGTSAPPG